MMALQEPYEVHYGHLKLLVDKSMIIKKEIRNNNHGYISWILIMYDATKNIKSNLLQAFESSLYLFFLL